MADHLEPFREVLTSAGTEIEGHVVDWCVENIVPQRQLTDRQACFVDYENIVADREAEFRRIFTFIGKPFDPRALDRSTNLSATTFLGRDGAKRRATREMRSWRDVMSAEEIRGAMEIVKRFGLDHLCKEGSEERRAAPARA
jgi:hypothetical protein